MRPRSSCVMSVTQTGESGQGWALRLTPSIGAVVPISRSLPYRGRTSGALSWPSIARLGSATERLTPPRGLKERSDGLDWVEAFADQMSPRVPHRTSQTSQCNPVIAIIENVPRTSLYLHPTDGLWIIEDRYNSVRAWPPWSSPEAVHRVVFSCACGKMAPCCNRPSIMKPRSAEGHVPFIFGSPSLFLLLWVCFQPTWLMSFSTTPVLGIIPMAARRLCRSLASRWRRSSRGSWVVDQEGQHGNSL